MLKVIDLDHKGRGIAKLNNKVVFIKNALPLEIVEINIIEDKKNYINAEVSKYIKKSKKRVNANCPYYNNCGGCNIMHMCYNDQLDFKENKINNIIKKYLKKEIKINKIVKCDTPFCYRNKITLKVKNNKIGFYDEKSHNIVEISNCLIADKDINNLIVNIKKLDLNNVNEIIIRKGINKPMVIFSTNQKLNIDLLKNDVDSIYLKNNKGYSLIYGDEFIYNTIGKYKFAILPDAFFQVNNNTCEKLYSKVKELVKENCNVLDLYCGTGTISSFVSDNNNVLGIEINEQAIKCANINKEINNIKNLNFILGDSSTSIKEFRPDVIILDPPRSGLNKNTIIEVLKYNANRIIYVSCDTLTLVRDLNLLDEKYEICEITPFDMFPNTDHVECVCLLQRK